MMFDDWELDEMVPAPWTLAQIDRSKLEGLDGEALEVAIGEQCACLDCGFAAGTVSDPRTREQLCPACLDQRERIPVGLHHWWQRNRDGTTTVHYFWGLARLASATDKRYDWAFQQALLDSVEPFSRILERSWHRAQAFLNRHRGPGLARVTPTRNERKASHG